MFSIVLFSENNIPINVIYYIQYAYHISILFRMFRLVLDYLKNKKAINISVWVYYQKKKKKEVNKTWYMDNVLDILFLDMIIK